MTCRLPEIPHIRQLRRCLKQHLRDETPPKVIGHNKPIRTERASHEFSCGKEARIVANAFGNKLGEGLHRTGHAYDKNCVLKIPQDVDGARANLREAVAWNRISNTNLSRFFAPVEHIGKYGEFLIMPYVDTHLDDDIEEEERISDEMQAELWDLDSGRPIVDDIAPSNIGYYRGRYVLFDYGWGLNLK